MSKNKGRPLGNTEPKTLLAKKLQKIYGVSGFSKISEKLEISKDAMRYYLVGDRDPPVSLLSKISTITNVSVDWLIDNSDTREGPVYRSDCTSGIVNTESVFPTHASPQELRNTAKTLLELADRLEESQ